MDCSPPGSSVHEIFQTRILEWVAISFSKGSSRPRDRTQNSCTLGRFFTNWANSTFQKPPCLHWNQAPPKGQKVLEKDIPCKFSSNAGTQPWASIYRLRKVTPNPQTCQNSWLDTSLHSREKKSSSTHQDTEASFPNQETLTSHSSNPTYREEPFRIKRNHKLPEYRKATPNTAI